MNVDIEDLKKDFHKTENIGNESILNYLMVGTNKKKCLKELDEIEMKFPPTRTSEKRNQQEKVEKIEEVGGEEEHTIENGDYATIVLSNVKNSAFIQAIVNTIHSLLDGISFTHANSHELPFCVLESQFFEDVLFSLPIIFDPHLLLPVESVGDPFQLFNESNCLSFKLFYHHNPDQKEIVARPLSNSHLRFENPALRLQKKKKINNNKKKQTNLEMRDLLERVESKKKVVRHRKNHFSKIKKETRQYREKYSYPNNNNNSNNNNLKSSKPSNKFYSRTSNVLPIDHPEYKWNEHLKSQVFPASTEDVYVQLHEFEQNEIEMEKKQKKKNFLSKKKENPPIDGTTRDLDDCENRENRENREKAKRPNTFAVTSAHIKWIPIGSQLKKFGDQQPCMKFTNIPLMYLEPGEIIDVDLYAVRHCPISTKKMSSEESDDLNCRVGFAYHRELSDIKGYERLSEKKSDRGDPVAAVYNMCGDRNCEEENVFEIITDKKTGIKKLNVIRPYECTDCTKCHVFGIKNEGVPESYVVKIESLLGLNSYLIFRRALLKLKSEINKMDL